MRNRFRSRTDAEAKGGGCRSKNKIFRERAGVRVGVDGAGALQRKNQEVVERRMGVLRGGCVRTVNCARLNRRVARR